jgi:hypothetical protein
MRRAMDALSCILFILLLLACSCGQETIPAGGFANPWPFTIYQCEGSKMSPQFDGHEFYCPSKN